MHLIVGASGELGSRVARRLLAAGERVRLTARDPARLAPLSALGGETVRLDLLEPHGLAAALQDVERVVYAAHGLVPPSRSNTAFAVDGEGARRLADAAATARVRQVVFVSVANADRQATAFARVKRDTELYLERAGVPWTVLRPSIFPENHALQLMGAPLRAGKPVAFFGPGTKRINWISADDVAADVVRVLADPGALGAVRELRGVDYLSRREVLALLERRLGVSATRRHVPPGVVRLMRGLTRALHPGMHVLFDMVLHEIAGGDDLADEVEQATWVGPTRVADVIDAWASELEAR